MFETRYAFSRTQAQTVRTSRPEVVREFDTEAEALAALKSPPSGAKVGMVRCLAPYRFIKRTFY